MLSSGKTEKSVWVVGVGNPLARDEGVGPVAVERLKAEPLPERVALLDAGTDFLAAMTEFADAGHVILIDAMRAGGVPGTIYRLTLEELEGRAKAGASDLSAHGLGVVEAVGLARATGMRVPPMVVFGVEPGEVAFGEGLSPAVEAAMQKLVADVREEIVRAS
ncbi:MAG TPA: hydrogenase maturation protease [Phycisphaerae bacterium]|nr:hydrogenase maturation protease [Phycisphaerae bacterium]